MTDWERTGWDDRTVTSRTLQQKIRDLSRRRKNQTIPQASTKSRNMPRFSLIVLSTVEEWKIAISLFIEKALQFHIYQKFLMVSLLPLYVNWLFVILLYLKEIDVLKRGSIKCEKERSHASILPLIYASIREVLPVHSRCPEFEPCKSVDLSPPRAWRSSPCPRCRCRRATRGTPSPSPGRQSCTDAGTAARCR